MIAHEACFVGVGACGAIGLHAFTQDDPYGAVLMVLIAVLLALVGYELRQPSIIKHDQDSDVM